MPVQDLPRSERILKEVRYRIQEQIDHFGGVLPERHASVSFLWFSRILYELFR